MKELYQKTKAEFFALSPQKWLQISAFLMSDFVLVSHLHYALQFAYSNEIGWEAAVIRVFTFYSIVRPAGLIRRFASLANQSKLGFLLLYLPYILYSLWFAGWGTAHQWPVAILYPVVCIAFVLFSWNTFQALEK